MPDEPFIPIRLLLEDFGVSTTGLLEFDDGTSVLDEIGIRSVGIIESELQTRAHFTVVFTDELVFRFPGLDMLAIVLGGSGLRSEFPVEADLRPPRAVRLADVPVVLRIGSAYLRPALAVVDPDTNVTRYEIDRTAPHVDVLLATVTLAVDEERRVTLDSGSAIRLPLCAVGDTGLILEGTLALDLSPDQPTLRIDDARIILPDTLPLPPGTALLIDDARIRAAGFSGSVSVELPLRYDESTRRYEYPAAMDGDPTIPAELFGLSGGLTHVRLTLEQNQLTGCEIRGGLLVPYFDEPVAIQVGIEPGSAGGIDFTVGLAGDPVRVVKEDLLGLEIRALTAGVQDDVAFLSVSGALEPLLMASDGLQWPRLDVTDLGIDARGRLRIKEAWLDLKELATLDLFGFHFELNRIGLGYQEPDDKLWIDLSGSLRLIEQIPVGLGVEGFRLTWPRTLLEDGVSGPLEQALAIAGRLEVKFDGVYLFYGVPGAVEFEGLIRFFKEAQKVGFAGDVALRVPATGFAAQAGLMVGMNLAEPPYPFLYAYLDVELPAGIPLGQSGLALKGALGLFGLNVAPARTPEQNWYYDWYKRGPKVGAHPTDKWRDERDALAIGLGVTITTVDGYIKGVRGLIVLAVPGPVLIIEGRALILNGLLPLPAEPPLRALAIFDGQAQTVQFNLEAEAELVEDVLEAYGMVEAFFDFRDVTNWHLYLGQDTPPERRIRADVLKLGDAFLFKADAYLMLDMVGEHTLRSRLGAMIGFRPPIPPVGPVHVTLDAVIDGTAELTLLPEQVHGRLSLEARIELSAFGFGLTMSADAELGADGPRPLEVDAELHVRAELPLPLSQVEEFLPDFAQDAVPDIPPLEVDATLQFSWTAPEPPEIASPLVSVVAQSPFSEGGGALTIHERAAVASPDSWRSAAEI
jgi:hypothetical protein